MRPTAVHKHICDELEEVEIVGQKEMQAQRLVERVAGLRLSADGIGAATYKEGDNESHTVDEQQVFGDGWNFSSHANRLNPICAQKYEKIPL